MFDKKTVKQSVGYAAAAVLYVSAVATLMSGMEKVVGQKEDSVLAPVGFLLLLVVSVAMMGMLIFGKPVMLYIDGKKRDGVSMLMCTIGCLAVFTVLLFVAITLY
jgi:hypothetical protein